MAEGESRYADNNGVRIHYRIAGAGPPLVLLHGFPDYWGGWSRQFAALAGHCTLIAPDMRGFNKSGRRLGDHHYAISRLAGDVLAVMDDAGLAKATVAGHDLGGMVAWWLAYRHADRVTRLAVLAAPHPADFLAGRSMPEVRKATHYLDRLTGEADLSEWTPERLCFWVQATGEREKHLDAMRRTDMEAVRSIYRANLSATSLFPAMKDFRASVPTLAMLSEDDPFVLPVLFNNIAAHVEGQFQVHRLSEGGHFMHVDRASIVNPLLLRWVATP